MSLSGNLRTMSFVDLLQFLNANQDTGTLQLRKGHVLKMIFFENGRIISSSSSDPKDYLGHFLVAQGLISEEELRIAMDIQRSSKMLLGKILVTGGKVSEEEMQRLLKLKTEETIHSIFLWEEGEFTFYHDEFINRLFVRILLDPQSLIFEGVLRRDEWTRIRGVFPHNNVVLERVPRAMLDLSTLDPKSRMIYAMVDGFVTIEDIALSVHTVDYHVCRTLFHLYELGYLRIAKIMPAPDEEKAVVSDHSFRQMLNLAKEKMEKNRYEEALDLLRELKPTADGYDELVMPLLVETEKKAVQEISKILPPEKILEILIPLDQVANAHLTPEEGFLLSRIDGSWDVRSILSVTPMKEVEALRLLKRLMDRGIVGVKGTHLSRELS